MFDGPVRGSEAFIQVLRDYRDAEGTERGGLANVMADAIVGKYVDLAEVRQRLIDAEEQGLYDALEAFARLIEPYLEEGAADE